MKKYALFFAWLIALCGFVLSLYYGEVVKLEPCRLCWYQRCALFPLAILLGIAAFREDFSFVPYGAVLAGAGFLFASYQSLEMKFPALRTSAMCGYVRSCSEVSVEFFGFLSFPNLSALGFAAIFFFLLAARSRRSKNFS